MQQEKIDQLIKSEYTFLLQEKKDWSLTAGPQDLELVAHALRVLLHARTAANFLPDYLALVDCQNADGGWSPFSADNESTVWVSTFCGLMLIRGNLLLKQESITKSVHHAIDYFLDTQHQDGRWVDPRWADLDTTSHPVSFFNVVMALGEPHHRSDMLRSWERGARFIVDNQSIDGGWYDYDFHPSGVEITAHLIQDALIADLVIDKRIRAIRESCEKGAEKLYEWQAPDGSWDEENIDHTMDCTRSLMVVTRALETTQGNDVIEKGLQWILTNKNTQGWGDFPGMETNLERTCDGLDTLLKYKAYRDANPLEVVKLWGYAV